MKTILTALGVWLFATVSLFAVDVRVTVEKTEATLRDKVELRVRIDQRLTEEQLTKLGTKLRDERGKEFKRTFIQYWLESQPTQTIPWAVTNFTPKPDVTINGLTLDLIAELRGDKYQPPGELIGDWLVEVLPGRTLIYRNEGKLLLESRFGASVEGVTKELVDQRAAKRNLYRVKDWKRGDLVYEIAENGRLEIRGDDDRLWSISEDTDPEAAAKRRAEKKKAEDAVSALKQREENTKKADDTLNLGLKLRDSGNAKSALKYFRKVVDEWPETKAADTARSELKKLGEK